MTFIRIVLPVRKQKMEFGIADILGWVGALALVTSYLLTNMRVMRIANSIGCMALITYAAILGLPSVILMNASCLFIHICYLLFPNRTEDIMKSHMREVYIAFSVYCVAFLSYSVISGYSWQEMIGVVSSLGFIGGWMLPSERRMRIVCAAAIAMNIAYAVLVFSPQVIFSNSVSLVINIARLVHMGKSETNRTKGIASESAIIYNRDMTENKDEKT